MLAQYRRLLDRYHALVDTAAWHDSRKALVVEMDRLWGRMSQRDCEAAMEHARKLYEARLGCSPWRRS